MRTPLPPHPPPPPDHSKTADPLEPAQISKKVAIPTLAESASDSDSVGSFSDGATKPFEY
jgi:hypothetical protein